MTAPASLAITSAPIFTAPPKIPVAELVEAASTLATAADLAAFAAMLPTARGEEDVDETAASVAA